MINYMLLTNEHIKNIYKEQELEENSTIRKFQTVQLEGKREVKRDVNYYCLDVIISVGYRVKSKKGTQFRIWATKILKEYLIKGYSINLKRLKQKQLNELTSTIELIKNSNDNALVSLALLIASSDPKQKELMVKLVVNLLVD